MPNQTQNRDENSDISEEAGQNDNENMQSSYTEASSKARNISFGLTPEETEALQRRALSLFKPERIRKKMFKYKCHACIFTCETKEELIAHFEELPDELEINDDHSVYGSILGLLEWLLEHLL
jgi:hypothetical protein